MDLDKLFNGQKFFRRLVLVWALAVTTSWAIFLMDPDLLKGIGSPGATVVLGIFGFLTTIIGFYQWHRKTDDEERIRRIQEAKDSESINE